MLTFFQPPLEGDFLQRQGQHTKYMSVCANHTASPLHSQGHCSFGAAKDPNSPASSSLGRGVWWRRSSTRWRREVCDSVPARSHFWAWEGGMWGKSAPGAPPPPPFWVLHHAEECLSPFSPPLCSLPLFSPPPWLLPPSNPEPNSRQEVCAGACGKVWISEGWEFGRRRIVRITWGKERDIHLGLFVIIIITTTTTIIIYLEVQGNFILWSPPTTLPTGQSPLSLPWTYAFLQLPYLR